MEPVRESFMFYRSFYEAIKTMPDLSQANVYNAIFSYIFDNKEPILQGIDSTVFTLIKPLLDANKKNYFNGKKDKKTSKIESKKQPKRSESEESRKPNRSETEAKLKPTESETEGKDKGIRYKEDSLYISSSLNTSRVRANGATASDYYGIHNNVFLENYAYEQLKQVITNCDELNDYINRLSGHIKQGKSCGDPASTILKWWNLDKTKEKSAKQAPDSMVDRVISAEELNIKFPQLREEDL